jgi:hypothetical protein
MIAIVYLIIAAAAVLGALAAIYRMRARQRLEAKLDHIIELLERRPP